MTEWQRRNNGGRGEEGLLILRLSDKIIFDLMQHGILSDNRLSDKEYHFGRDDQ